MVHSWGLQWTIAWLGRLRRHGPEHAPCKPSQACPELTARMTSIQKLLGFRICVRAGRSYGLPQGELERKGRGDFWWTRQRAAAASCARARGGRLRWWCRAGLEWETKRRNGFPSKNEGTAGPGCTACGAGAARGPLAWWFPRQLDLDLDLDMVDGWRCARTYSSIRERHVVQMCTNTVRARDVFTSWNLSDTGLWRRSVTVPALHWNGPGYIISCMR